MLNNQYLSDWVVRAQKIAGLGIWDQDPVSDELWWSDETFRILGLEPQSVAPNFDIFLQMVHPDDRDLIVTQTKLSLQSDETPYKVEYRIIWPDKSERFIHEEALIERGSDGKPAKITGILQDITESKLATEALRESEDRYKRFVETTNNLVTQIDREGTFIFVNISGQKIYGLEKQKLIGMNAFQFIHPEDQAKTKAWFQQCVDDNVKESSVESRQVNQVDGTITHLLWTSTFIYNDSGNLVGVNGIAHDITARKLLENEIIKSKKLEATATLAGGIAHDFNNLLAAIIGNLDMVLDDVPESNPARRLIENSMKASQRAHELTQKFITFATGGSPLKRNISISELLGMVLQNEDFSSCQIEQEIANDLWSVEADKVQLKEAIINLLLNAKEASSDLCKITVSAKNIQPTAPCLKTNNIPPNQYLKIEIHDQGKGIPRENLSKIFDPYYSTKQMGAQKGMGLGLTVSYSIIKKHGGFLFIDSEEGKGTAATIFLPV